MKCATCGAQGKHWPEKICPDCRDAGKTKLDGEIMRGEKIVAATEQVLKVRRLNLTTMKKKRAAEIEQAKK